MIYPLVIELAGEGIPVSRTCGVLGFSKQAFYKWRARPCSDRDWDDAHLVNAALDIHGDDPAFGYRFIADELNAQGLLAGEPRPSALSGASDLVVDVEETGSQPQGQPTGA